MDDFKPSAFTPFLRRFTDERVRDLRQLREFYSPVRALHFASAYSREDAVYKVGAGVYGRCAEIFPEDILGPIAWLMSNIVRLERPIFEFPEINWDLAHLT